MPVTRAPYGSWKSPVSTKLLTDAGIGLSQLAVGTAGVCWLEGRPSESGRVVLVTEQGDATPAPYNVRSRVHEYPGGSYFVHGPVIFFSNFIDQVLYRIDPGRDPRPITAPAAIPGGFRYADGSVTPDGKTIICIRESHTAGAEAKNDIVCFPADGSGEPQSIVHGSDFYSFPRISPDGKRLAWTTWNHPQMPWDGTELWVADLEENGAVGNAKRIAGGASESIFQPEWSLDGSLHFVSDRSGWWNLYEERDGDMIALAPMEAEFGLPQWVFGLSRYAFLDNGRIACVYSSKGLDYLALIDRGSRSISRVDFPYETISDIRSDGGHLLYLIAASSSIAAQVVSLNVQDASHRVICRSMQVELDAEDIAKPEPIEFPTERGRTAYAFFYPPTNRNYAGADGERPPLLVLSHGGPTSASNSSLRVAIQFWTSRGFALVDVNYGGSTGYGRSYRERLNGMWGVVDVEDCIHAAQYLERRGAVDGRRMAIRGGSAGGYTTLCALVFSNVFAAGASYYGVADLKSLMQDTHKFEARYLDGLVGPYPQAAQLYHDRSPLNFADRLSCPVILMQGLEDKMVPPSQAEVMIDALRKKKLPFAYVSFPTEGHGFREAANIRRAAEAELYFYSRIFGFTPADEIEPVTIENL